MPGGNGWLNETARRSHASFGVIRRVVRSAVLAARGPTYLRAVTVAHILGVIAGGWVTVTLADSLFFNLDADASRVQVLRYLVITMLPVAVLARVLGPALDRVVRGPRWFGVCSNVLRAACCIGLALTLGTIGFLRVCVHVAHRQQGLHRCQVRVAAEPRAEQ